MYWMLPHLRNIPASGGTRIRAKKIIIAVAYTAYFMALREDSLSSVFVSFSVIPFRPTLCTPLL